MAKVKAKVKETAAELEAKKAVTEAKKAAKDGAKAAKDLAGALAEQIRESGMDERASELAHDLSERAGDLAEKVRDSEAYGRTQAKGAELASKAREKAHERGLDDKAEAWLAQAGKMSDDTLERFGAWLTNSKAADKLGLQQQKRSKWSLLLTALLGGAVGYVIGMMTAPKRGEELRQDFEQRGAAVKDDLTTAAERVAQDTNDISAPAAEKPLADKIRTKLGEDPRTSSLPRLNINVAEGTVFVRGAVEPDADQQAIRDVIAGIPGVKDVDLQLT
jgi:gas vesicle protein